MTFKKPLIGLAVVLMAATAFGDAARITTHFISADISADYPGFTGLSVDSLGAGHFSLVPLSPASANSGPWRALRHGSGVEYFRQDAPASASPCWTIRIKSKEIWLESHWSTDDPPEPLVMDLDTGVTYPTLLGLVETNGSIQFPALLHFPGQGTFQISARRGRDLSLGYAATRKDVRITFPAASSENPKRAYRLDVVDIFPKIPGVAKDARFDGFRRNWLNIFQINPQRRVLSNNAGSDTCAFCYYEYADMAMDTPSLADDVTALDMIRQTLDGIIGGTLAYGMPSYTPGHEDHPGGAADTWPSLLIAAEDYVQGSHDNAWLAANYSHLKSWADYMLATDHSGDGLTEYSISGNSGIWPNGFPKRRPANWWDTIGFGYEDAYANALAYRALLGMAELAKQDGQSDDQARYQAAADKIKAVYFDTFYDPQTGVLAGWRSADGQLHDYYFLWVNGIAIHYGLVPTDKANDIMDRLLAKMNDVGYTNFALGLPGNLIPVARKDYVHHEVRFGGGKRADGSDGFQYYENGGATACFAYFTLAALYDLGRINDGDRILFPMLDSFENGGFQGRGSNGKSKDWKKWDGTCEGYEGLLTDNYYALLAVKDREAALKTFKK